MTGPEVPSQEVIHAKRIDYAIDIGENDILNVFAYGVGTRIKPGIWNRRAQANDQLYVLMDVNNDPWIGFGARRHEDLLSCLKNNGIFVDQSSGLFKIQISLDARKRVIKIGFPIAYSPLYEDISRKIASIVPINMIGDRVKLVFGNGEKYLGEKSFRKLVQTREGLAIVTEEVEI